MYLLNSHQHNSKHNRYCNIYSLNSKTQNQDTMQDMAAGWSDIHDSTTSASAASAPKYGPT